jgi:outer membrane protein OmpA-like peptidoglycan-associated protein
VKFKTASAVIMPGKDSEEVLVAVQQVLNEHPEIKKVRVEGHTDNRGNAAMNMKLSAARAASVVKWLTGHGIEAARLTSEGFGLTKPLDTNDTEEGRHNNRRVEFHIAE